jgi:penicillin-binding protein-related factor A (putative recombinase)
MEIDDNLKKEAEQKANKISFLGDDEKLKHLLQISREKGVVFAIKVAKSMNEPYLLDTFHDLLAKEGFYKDFVKK